MDIKNSPNHLVNEKPNGNQQLNHSPPTSHPSLHTLPHPGTNCAFCQHPRKRHSRSLPIRDLHPLTY